MSIVLDSLPPRLVNKTQLVLFHHGTKDSTRRIKNQEVYASKKCRGVREYLLTHLNNMEFRKYNKIKRLGTSDVEGILDGLCYIQEKIDGANASIWREDGKICCGSRNNKLTSDANNIKEGDNHFNGFLEYVAGHKGIREVLLHNPTYRLYGEWLVKHSINYAETKYRHFYLFDIEYQGVTEYEWKNAVAIKAIGEEYGIETANLLSVIENPTTEQLNELVGKSVLTADKLKGEGIVIKNPDYINKWGDNIYAKIVSEKFKETNAIVFGGNNKHSDSYLELYFVNKFMTLGRVSKIIQKIHSKTGKVGVEKTAQVINTAYHDMLEEEFWTIANKKKIINFRTLSHLSLKKARQIFFDILEDSISVADKE